MKKAADIESGDLKLGEKYVSFNFTMGLSGVQSTFCFDQSKANLLYLVEPRVDTEGIGAALDNLIAVDIDERRDTTTWWELKKLPLQFIEYWFSINNGITPLATHWPPNYKTLMIERAHVAQKRLLGVVEEGNVKTVNFRRQG